jgi:trimethylamine--corrinoid protein Co-methyltransferase
MRTNKKIFSTLQSRLLSDTQIQEVHLASLHILAVTGVKVEGEEALELLRTAGARVMENGLVRIPAHLVEEALRSAPETVTLYHRDRKDKMVLEGNNIYFGTGSDTPFTYDLESGEKRRTVRQDTADFAVLVDALPNIHFAMSMGSCQDMPPEATFRCEFETMVTNTTKPLCLTVEKVEDVQKIVEAAVVIAGSIEELQNFPFFVVYDEPVAPLTHPKDSVDKLLYMAEAKLPVIYSPGISAGASGPVTLAGCLAVANAEILSGLVLHQLKARGAPFVYGATITILDMSSANFTHGSPEHYLMSTARAELAHWYNLPVFGVGGRTDSKCLDVQAGIEYALSAFMESLCGANMIHDVGYLGTGIISSHAMVVMANELYGILERIRRGIRIDEETLAEDVINHVGPGGEFVTHPHTLKHFRQELWVPEFMNRDNVQNYEDKGSPQLAVALQEKARTILREHHATPLPDDVCKRIAEILA